MRSHTHVHSHVCTYTHTGALTHVLTYTYTHTCIYAVVCSHKCLHAYTLILTYMQVLISGTWLWFSRVNPPKATSLREAVLQPPTTLQSPGCVFHDQPLVACKVSGVRCFLAKPRWLQALGGEQGSHRSRRGQEGAEQLPAVPTV